MARVKYTGAKYGSRNRMSGSLSRKSAAVRVVQKAVRNKLVANKRKVARRPAAATNARAILANSAKLTQLTKRLYGPIQIERSYTDTGAHITANSPWCFNVNNPFSDFDCEPHVFHINALGVTHNFESFKKYVAPHDDEDAGLVSPQHPCFLKWAQFEFEFKGTVDDTHIQIDIVQPRGVAPTSWYEPADTVHENMLPKNLKHFQQLAGFTQHRIDKKAFRVLQTRKLYMDSRPTNPINEDPQYPTVEATTRAVKRCKMHIPINRQLKPLNEMNFRHTQTGVPRVPNSPDWYEQTFTNAMDAGPYSYANIDPRQQIWCIISCSDQSALGASVTGDAVECTIHRTMCWRDPVAAGS